jgi:chemotaxis protein MotA
MHVLVGVIGFVGVFAAAFLAERTQGFTGLLYVPALLLVGAGPPFVVLASYRFGELLRCAQAVLHAARFDAARSRRALYDDLAAFAAELRQRRPAEALAVAERARNPLLRQLAPPALKGYAGEAIERTSSAATYCLASALRQQEEILASLARVAPAAGLVGTVLGLIALLKDLSRFEQLGPSMALALLCTLYGLVLANAVYQPLARLLHHRAAVVLEESKLLTRALVLAAEGKPIADVRALFDVAAGPEPVEGLRPGGDVDRAANG